MEKALKAATEQKMIFSHATDMYGIKHTSLFYRLKKAKNTDKEVINGTASLENGHFIR